MEIVVHKKGASQVAEAKSNEIILTDTGSALDLMAEAKEQGCDKLILHKENICEDFFSLSTGLAGEVLQKYTNYNLQVAIVGDFSVYTSKSLRDFIRESNRGNQVFFLADVSEALERLHQS